MPSGPVPAPARLPRRAAGSASSAHRCGRLERQAVRIDDDPVRVQARARARNPARPGRARRPPRRAGRHTPAGWRRPRTTTGARRRRARAAAPAPRGALLLRPQRRAPRRERVAAGARPRRHVGEPHGRGGALRDDGGEGQGAVDPRRARPSAAACGTGSLTGLRPARCGLDRVVGVGASAILSLDSGARDPVRPPDPLRGHRPRRLRARRGARRDPAGPAHPPRARPRRGAHHLGRRRAARAGRHRRAPPARHRPRRRPRRAAARPAASPCAPTSTRCRSASRPASTSRHAPTA